MSLSVPRRYVWIDEDVGVVFPSYYVRAQKVCQREIDVVPAAVEVGAFEEVEYPVIRRRDIEVFFYNLQRVGFRFGDAEPFLNPDERHQTGAGEVFDRDVVI